MRPAQVRLIEIGAIYRRRWKVVVVPTIIVGIVCTVGAFQLPRKYEATTKMLIRADETLGIRDYSDGGGFVEQLRSYGDIIYSRTFIQGVIDSLGLGKTVQTEADRQALVNDVSRFISTDTRGSDAFSITFANSNPQLAMRGAEVVANLFIQMKVRIENRQNLLAIEFLEKKVDELRIGLESSARSLVSSLEQNSDQAPSTTKTAYTEIGDDLKTTVAQIRSYQGSLLRMRELLTSFKNYPQTLRTEEGKQPLLDLQREELPYAADLRTLVGKYDEATRRYTGKWPEVERLENQLTGLIERVYAATETEVGRLQMERADLEHRRGILIEQIKQSSLSSRMNQEKQSNYEMNLRMYNDMNAKLEQARLKAEVESKGANQYIILDPPVYPTVPTRPNRKLLVAGGFGVGFFLGIVSVIIAEIFDTTIRSTRDIETYQKPIIALLPDGTRDYR